MAGESGKAHSDVKQRWLRGDEAVKVRGRRSPLCALGLLGVAHLPVLGVGLYFQQQV